MLGITNIEYKLLYIFICTIIQTMQAALGYTYNLLNQIQVFKWK